MSTPGARIVAAGLILVLFAANVGVAYGGGVIGVLVSFTGVLAGANVIAAGVLMADDPPAAHVGPALFHGAPALAAFLRRHHTVLGLVMASSAVTVVSGEAGPVLCFGMFALLLLGLSLTLINIRALGR